MFCAFTCLCFFVLFCIILLGQYSRSKSGEVSKLLCVYSQGGEWYYMKKLLAFIWIMLIRFKLKVKTFLCKVWLPYSRDKLKTYESLEACAPLNSSNPEFQDSVEFYGGQRNGPSFDLRMVRHPERQTELLMHLCVPALEASFVNPTFPACLMYNVDNDTFKAPGVHVKCEVPMRVWSIYYNGPLKQIKNDRDSKDKLVHVELKLKYRAFSNGFEVLKNISANFLAGALANEQWSGRFFEKLQQASSTFYKDKYFSQFGSFTGTLSLDGQSIAIDKLSGCKNRRHGAAPGDQCREFLNYTMQFENGASLIFGARSFPETLTHLRYGCYVTPYGQHHPITWHNVMLTHLLENYSNCYCKYFEVIFWVGRKKFRIRISNKSSWNKQNFMYNQGLVNLFRTEDRFLQCEMNGVFGHGMFRAGNRYFGAAPDCYKLLSSVKHLSEPKLNDADVVDKQIVELSQTASGNSRLCGGKGSQLGLLKQLDDDKVIVPNGIVITTSAYNKEIKSPNFQKFRKTIDKITDICSVVSENEITELRQQCESFTELAEHHISADLWREIHGKLTQMFEDKLGGMQFAVRSSSTSEDGFEVSGAGQMETYLNKQVDDISKCIVQCWASQFTFQAVEYRRQHGLKIDCSMAVVIQEMVQADYSGVIFTQDPITGNGAKMVINVAQGLGENVVSGKCDVQTIYVARCPNGEFRFLPSDKEFSGNDLMPLHDEQDLNYCINKENLQKLSNIGIMIENHFGGARDIEWSIKNDVIYILQARPITTMYIETQDDLIHEFDSSLSYGDELLTTANIGEMMPSAVTPLTNSIFGDMLNSIIQYNAIQIGLLKDFIHPIRAINSFCNHLFLNFHFMSLYSKLHIQSSETKFLYIALLGRVLESPTEDDYVKFVGRSKLWRRIWGLLVTCFGRLSASRKTKAWKKKLNDGYQIRKHYTAYEQITEIEKRIINYYLCWHDTVQNTSSSTMWIMALTHILSKYYGFGQQLYSKLAILLSTCQNVYSADVPTILNQICQEIIKSPQLETFLNMNVQFEATPWLLGVDSGDIGVIFRTFLSKHGHRCVRESEFRETSWNSEPHKIVEVIKAMVQTEMGQVIKQVKTKISTEDAVEQLQLHSNKLIKIVLKLVVAKARAGVGSREYGKSIAIEMGDVFKEAFKHLGKLMKAEGIIPDADLVYFFTFEEIVTQLKELSRLPPSLVAKALRRRKVLEIQSAIKYAELSYGIPKPVGGETKTYTTGVTLSGMPVGQGCIRGTARVIKSLECAKAIVKNDILIVPYTDIGWSPYFPMISGLVTEKGGIVSHGSVVAREYGLPCIVGVLNATDCFTTGDTVILNANEGTIQKIKTEIK